MRSTLPSYAIVMERRLVSYSPGLWARVPIRYLLLAVDTRHEEFAHLRPMLLRFVGASMPHLMPPMQSLLNGVERELLLAVVEPGSGPAIEEGGLTAAEGLYATLVRLDQLPIREQYRHFNLITSAMLSTLEPETPRPCVEKLVAIWERMESIVPRRLYEETLRLWLSSPQAATGTKQGSGRGGVGVVVDEALLLRESPLIMFRVDERVLASALHLRCLMHILQFYLDASRSAKNLRLLKACAQNPNATRGFVSYC